MAALFVLLLAASATAWDIEAVAPGSMPEIAVDHQGGVHLAWAIEDEDDSLFYGRRVEGGWDITLPPASDSFAIPFDLAVAGNGRVHIGFHEHHSGDVGHVEGTGADWQTTLIRSEGHDGWVPSIALGPDDTPHLASFDSAVGIEHATRNGAQWEIESVGTGPLVDNFGAAIAVDDTGKVFVCYHDGDFTPPPEGNGALHCASRTSGAWTHETVDAEGDVGKFVAISLDSQGRPHLAYLKWETGTSGTSGTIRYARREGSSWVVEDITVLGEFGAELKGANRTISIAVDHQDRPHVAASDRQQVVYAYRTENGWAVETVIEQTASAFVFGQLASLALDPGGQPHIAFYELPEQTTSSQGTVYYATRAGHTQPAPRRPSRRLSPPTARKGKTPLPPR